jgi:hypothetical protein
MEINSQPKSESHKLERKIKRIPPSVDKKGKIQTTIKNC